MEKTIFIGFKANTEEHKMLNLIMKNRKRHTKSDTLRNLIQTEYEKILQQNKSIAIKQ